MTKKRIAIVCVILNLVLLTQVCFGSVSALYDAVVSSEVEVDEHDGHVHEESAQAELHAESVCSQQQLENAKCHVCSWKPVSGNRYCSVCNKNYYTTWEACACGSTRNVPSHH